MDVISPWYTLPYNSFLRRLFMFIKLFTFTSMCVWMFLRCIKILMPHYEDEFHLMSALNVIHRYLLDFLHSIFLYKARKKHSHINVWIFNMKTIFDCVCKMNKPSWCEVHHLKLELCKRYHFWYTYNHESTNGCLCTKNMP